MKATYLKFGMNTHLTDVKCNAMPLISSENELKTFMRGG